MTRSRSPAAGRWNDHSDAQTLGNPLLSLLGPLARLGHPGSPEPDPDHRSPLWLCADIAIDTHAEQINALGALVTNVRISLVPRRPDRLHDRCGARCDHWIGNGAVLAGAGFLTPVATAIYAIPKLAILPLMLIVFGLGESSKIAIIVVSIFFLIVLKTDERRDGDRPDLPGCRPEPWREPVAALHHLVAWPRSPPTIFDRFPTGNGISAPVIVGTEFLDGSSGSRTGSAGTSFARGICSRSADHLFVGLLVVAFIAWVLNLLLEVIERRLLPWRAEVL